MRRIAQLAHLALVLVKFKVTSDTYHLLPSKPARKIGNCPSGDSKLVARSSGHDRCIPKCTEIIKWLGWNVLRWPVSTPRSRVSCTLKPKGAKKPLDKAFFIFDIRDVELKGSKTARQPYK
jgi:hypothetical protein